MNYVEYVVIQLNDLIPGLPPELIDLYALLVLTQGESTSLDDVHDAWSVWKSRIRPDHHSLIPFNELSQEVQELDRKYMLAIRKVASNK